MPEVSDMVSPLGVKITLHHLKSQTDLTATSQPGDVWMSLKEHGVDKYARLIEQNVAQAGYLAKRVEASKELELVAPVPLNVVCFRFVEPELDDQALNALNQELLVRLQESGVAVPNSTKIHGKYCLRVAITNHRTRREDLDMMVREVIALGRGLLQDKKP